jgi:hypothetical protein
MLEVLEDRCMPSVTVGSNYPGLDFNASGGFEPPDTTSAVGPSSTVEAVNQTVAIYPNKTNSSGAITLDLPTFFFTNGGRPPVASGSFQADSFAMWDNISQRFIVGDLDTTDTTSNASQDKNQLLLAVSKTSNPTDLTTANWNFYGVPTSESNIALQDYPGNPGYNNDALVVTFNSFTSSGFDHSLVLAVSMNAITSGSPLTLNSNFFETDVSQGSLRPTSMQDSAPGDPMWLVAEHGDNTNIDVIKMSPVLSSTPTFTTTTIPVNPYSTATAPLQPDGSAITNNIDSRILKAAEQNNQIVASQTVSNAAGNLDNARWYDFNVASGTPTLAQQGDVTGGAKTYNAYPGIDINAQNQIGMTYIGSGTNPGQFMSMYVTGRTPGDPAGTMETPVLVQAGQGVANYNGTREGDLSGINIDPTNGSFWASNEFANNESTNWGTAIANFVLGIPVQVTSVSAVEGQALNNATVATFTDTSGLPAGSYSATINWGNGSVTSGTIVSTGANSYAVQGSNTYTEEGSYPISVTVQSSGGNSGSASGTASVADASLNGSGVKITAKIGQPLTNVLVGTFTDANPFGTVNDFTATVTWNEGNGATETVTGRVVQSGNTFQVYASTNNSFSASETEPVVVVVKDVGGSTTTINSEVNVPPASPLSLLPLYLTDSEPVTPDYPNLNAALTNLINAEMAWFTAFFQSSSQQSKALHNLVIAEQQYFAAMVRYQGSLVLFA